MSDEYYETLFVMDRIEDLAVRKFVTLSKFSKALGHAPSWAYNSLYNGISFRIKKINQIAKLLDVNVEYLITGKNKTLYNGYIDVNKVAQIKLPREEKSLAQMRSKVKRGLKDNINLSTLLDVMDITKKNINDFIVGE